MSGVPASDKADSGRAIYLRLLSQVRPQWRVFAGALLAMVVLAATEPAIPALLKPTLDGSFVDKDVAAVGWMAVLLVLVFLVRGLASFASSFAMAWVSSALVRDLRTRMFDRLTCLPTRYFDDHTSGRMISRITYDASLVTDAATTVLTTLVRDSLGVLGLLGWMLYLEWKLTLITFATTPLVLLVMAYFGRRVRRVAQRLQEQMGDVTHVVEESVEGHQIVRVFGAEGYERGRFRRAADKVRSLQIKFVVSSAATAPIAQVLTALGLALILYIAGHESARGEISVGSFVSFFMAMAMLFAPLKRLTAVNGRLQQGIAAAISVFALIDEPPERDRGGRVIERARGLLEFREVGFSYGRGRSAALHGVSLRIEPGETLALVGPSGAGKSTLISLIPRFYEPGQGAVLLDGIDVRELTLASLRRQIALVSQHVVLFNDTIAANIAYGAGEEADPERIAAAARAAHASEFIEGMPQGLATVIGERGVRLSGGQRQRLAIARAFFKDAPLLILDEATSSLDNVSERHIREALEELRRGRTTIIIAHRLSSIEQADRIALMAEGSIVDVGSHRELLERNHLYAGLYRFQFAPRGRGGSGAEVAR